MVAAANADESGGKTKEKAGKDARGLAVNQGAVPESANTRDRVGVKFDDGGNKGSAKNRKSIQNHPHASAAACRPLLAGCAALVPFLRGWRRRSGDSLPKLGCCHICFADLEKIATKVMG
jgi:hypothetical protein